jgi:hypothetical protein
MAPPNTYCSRFLRIPSSYDNETIFKRCTLGKWPFRFQEKACGSGETEWFQLLSQTETE